ncbi:FUSC family protein [Sphingomonas oleivorans]|nr:FUSC family protein [Sphingomonas oleivorans]
MMSHLPSAHSIVSLRRRDRGLAMLICVVRSAVSATFAYGGALTLQLHQPLWASVSALITTKDSFGDTFAECRSRVIGTAVGTILAIIGVSLLSPFRLSDIAELAIVTAIVAALVSNRPQWRVGIWTAAITLLSRQPGMDIWQNGLARFSEVALGSVVATGVATLELSLLERLFRRGFARRGGGDGTGRQ